MVNAKEAYEISKINSDSDLMLQANLNSIENMILQAIFFQKTELQTYLCDELYEELIKQGFGVEPVNTSSLFRVFWQGDHNEFK